MVVFYHCVSLLNLGCICWYYHGCWPLLIRLLLLLLFLLVTVQHLVSPFLLHCFFFTFVSLSLSLWLSLFFFFFLDMAHISRLAFSRFFFHSLIITTLRLYEYSPLPAKYTICVQIVITPPLTYPYKPNQPEEKNKPEKKKRAKVQAGWKKGIGVEICSK